jgi:hypothetical protein
MISYPQKLKRVLDAMGGVYTVSDLLERIRDGRMQSFTVNNTWAITEINPYPQKKRLQVVAMIGDLADGEAMHATISDFAEKMAVDSIVTYGRRGWMPWALAHGWRIKTKGWLYQKDL